MRRFLSAILCVLLLCASMPRVPAQAAPGAPAYGPFCAALASVRLPAGAALADVWLAAEAWCLRADAALASAEMAPAIVCEMEEEPGAWTVLRFLCGQTRLATLRVDTAGGEIRLPGEDTLHALADGAFLRAVLDLGNHGLSVDPAWYTQRATLALAVDWLMTAYEHLAGPVSLDGIIVGEGATEAARKAAAAGLLLPEELEELEASRWQSTALSHKELVEILLRWASLVERVHCRRGAEPATIKEGKGALQLAIDLAGLPLNAGDGWPDAIGDMERIPLARVIYARGAAALLDQAMADNAPGPQHERWLPILDDTGNPEARAACGLGLMHYVLLEPDDFACFDPDRVMSMDALREHAQRFAAVALEHAWEDSEPSTVGQAAPMLHRLVREFAERPVYSGPVEVVDNGIGAPWYLSQEGSGPHSGTNCMPAAAAMVLRWLDPGSAETPESLRALHPLEGAPWYPEQVMEVFAEHGVPFALEEVELGSMVEALDAGRILLALLNENGTGHCVIVKGYVREGPGLWFLLYDPASPHTDAFGAPIGRNRLAEATELLFAIECHWWLYFDLSREARDGD
ncbi:MAG: hypothetical protein FWE77_03875 [Clostridia bacterium]|nr:hypothetical protein [Clostridia bacterium]